MSMELNDEIYVIISGEYSDWSIQGYAKTKDDAIHVCAYKNAHLKPYEDKWYYQTANYIHKHSCDIVYVYTLKFENDGFEKYEILSDTAHEMDFYSTDDKHLDELQDIVYDPCKHPWYLYVNVKIREANLNLAKKIAQDKLSKYLYEKMEQEGVCFGMIHNNLKHRKEEIIKFVDNHDYKTVHMNGMVQDIQKLKKYIEDNYQELSSMTYDIGWHGYTGEESKNMNAIQDAITHNIIELYAICIAALGGDASTDEDWVNAEDELPPDMEPIMVRFHIKDGTELTLTRAYYDKENGMLLMEDHKNSGSYIKHPNTQVFEKWRKIQK